MTKFLGVATDDMTIKILSGPAGSSLIGYEEETVEQALDKLKSFSTYGALRSYIGDATVVHITGPGIEGFFTRTNGVSPAENNGTVIVDGVGRSWVRSFVGGIQAIWFKPVGTSDQDASVAAAAAAVSYAIDSDGPYPLVPYCQWAIVDLPAGTWTLTEEVDVANKEVVWRAQVGTRVVNPQFLNGRLLRDGNKITDFSHGILDAATGFAVMLNRQIDEVVPVGGVGTASRLAAGNGRDSVAFYSGNRVPAPSYGTAAVTAYTSNGVTLATAMTDSEFRRMRVGMIIQTRHTPSKYASYVTAFTRTSVTVAAGWFLVDGTAVGTASTPPGTDGLDINVVRKAWAGNSNVFIDTLSYGTEAVGYEVGVSNAKAQSSGMGGNIATYGILSASLQGDVNDYYNTYAAITGGRWVNGYTPIGGVRNAFVYRGDLGRTDELQNLLTCINGAGFTSYNIDASGNVEAGIRGGGVAAPYIHDYHASGNVNDYDARVSVTGGTSANAQAIYAIVAGQVSLTAPAVDLSGVLRGAVDLGSSVGQLARRMLDGFFQRLRFGAGTVMLTSGTGSPEGVLAAAVGSLYTRTDGGTGTVLYVKETGAATATGWVAK